MKTTKRRDKGSGCVRQRKDGRWEARFSAAGQEPFYIYGKSKQDVINKLFAEQQKPPSVRDPENLTVGQWLDRWLSTVKVTLRPKTYDLYNSSATNHIKPHLANTKLRNVSKARIYDMFTALRKRGIGSHALQMVYKVLHRAFEVAVEEEKLDRNVVALVKKPPATNRERAILRTEDEIVRFRQAVKGSVYETLYLAALDTGCRQGELLALTWDCVDLARGLIYIRATLTRNDVGELIASSPKTASSVRAVRLTENTIQLLKTHRKQRMDPQSVQSAWVFPNWDGGPMRKDGYIRREFARLMTASKLPKITFHSLRHTHATMLAAFGVPMKATQERLGHSTTRMTMEVYSHATAAMQDHAVTALDEFYRQAGKKSEAISGQISGQTAESGSTHQDENAGTLTG